MKNIAMKYLVWILAAWIGSGYMTLSSASIAADCLTVGMTSVESRAADQVTSASMPDRHGNGDESIILDEPDAVDSDAAAPTGLEDTQVFAVAGDVPHQRIAVEHGRALPWPATSFVEPRFLRYARLLY